MSEIDIYIDAAPLEIEFDDDGILVEVGAAQGPAPSSADLLSAGMLAQGVSTTVNDDDLVWLSGSNKASGKWVPWLTGAITKARALLDLLRDGFWTATSASKTTALHGGRSLVQFEGYMRVTASELGKSNTMSVLPPGTSRGAIRLRYVTDSNSPHIYVDRQGPFYAYGTTLTGAGYNAEVLRAPDTGSLWFSCTKTGSPTVTAGEWITGSRGSMIKIRDTGAVVSNVVATDVSVRLPSTSEVFTVTGGTLTITSGILGAISDTQAAYTAAIISNVGVFFPSTMPLGTLYVSGYYIL